MIEGLAPLSDRVLVRPLEEEEFSPGGVLLPDNVREKSQRGEVIAVGPGVRNRAGELLPVAVEVGDTVVYSKYGGTDIRVQLEELLLLREPDVLAIVR